MHVSVFKAEVTLCISNCKWLDMKQLREESQTVFHGK